MTHTSDRFHDYRQCIQIALLCLFVSVVLGCDSATVSDKAVEATPSNTKESEPAQHRETRKEAIARITAACEKAGGTLVLKEDGSGECKITLH